MFKKLGGWSNTFCGFQDFELSTVHSANLGSGYFWPLLNPTIVTQQCIACLLLYCPIPLPGFTSRWQTPHKRPGFSTACLIRSLIVYILTMNQPPKYLDLFSLTASAQQLVDVRHWPPRLARSCLHLCWITTLYSIGALPLPSFLTSEPVAYWVFCKSPLHPGLSQATCLDWFRFLKLFHGFFNSHWVSNHKSASWILFFVFYFHWHPGPCAILESNSMPAISRLCFFLLLTLGIRSSFLSDSYP